MMTLSAVMMANSEFMGSRADSPKTARMKRDKNPSMTTTHYENQKSSRHLFPENSPEEEAALCISECTTPDIIQPDSSDESSSDSLSKIDEMDEDAP